MMIFVAWQSLLCVKEQREHPEKRLLLSSSEERSPTVCEHHVCPEGSVTLQWETGLRARSRWCAGETSPPPEERCAVSASAPASRAAPPSPSSETPASSACSGASFWLSRTPPPDYCGINSTASITKLPQTTQSCYQEKGIHHWGLIMLTCRLLWVIILFLFGIQTFQDSQINYYAWKCCVEKLFSLLNSTWELSKK